ncbi:MAG: succinate dehydrogenase, hydrophobic membrane anchor protein [Silvanigrellaceae bacterium]|nr:succinate dehydrogenase, hydrophobic membrane anchor protein [Silvanigrellaceae bacterium]
MVNVTSLTGNGLKDWLIQRITAVYFALYSIFILGFLCYHPQLQYEVWANLFHCRIFKVASILALAALLLHSWVGLWTITTDYLKCVYMRFTAQLFILLWLLGQFFWGLLIVWGQ